MQTLPPGVWPPPRGVYTDVQMVNGVPPPLRILRGLGSDLCLPPHDQNGSERRSVAVTGPSRVNLIEIASARRGASIGGVAVF
jgi:hypothetical protein